MRKILSDEVCVQMLAIYIAVLMIYNCLQQPAILEPAASIFDNDDDVEIEVVQESGDMDSDTDMIPRTEFSS